MGTRTQPRALPWQQAPPAAGAGPIRACRWRPLGRGAGGRWGWGRRLPRAWDSAVTPLAPSRAPTWIVSPPAPGATCARGPATKFHQLLPAAEAVGPWGPGVSSTLSPEMLGGRQAPPRPAPPVFTGIVPRRPPGLPSPTLQSPPGTWQPSWTQIHPHPVPSGPSPHRWLCCPRGVLMRLRPP
jgi:hypothetical protein